MSMFLDPIRVGLFNYGHLSCPPLRPGQFFDEVAVELKPSGWILKNTKINP